MLFDAAEPLQDPAQLQARLAAVMSMLEAQNGAVERLRGERDALRAERDTAHAEVCPAATIQVWRTRTARSRARTAI
jgi:hypothetical protein